MKNKTNFIWLYSVLLFSASLLLILISTLSQSRLTPSDAITQNDEQQAFNQTIQKSVTDLIKENENLRGELRTANETISQLQIDTEAFANDNKQIVMESEATEFLIEAEMYFNVGQYANSREKLQNVNVQLLSANGQQLYHWIREKLTKLGYKLQD